MKTLPRSNQNKSLKQTCGPPGGPAKTSAAQSRAAKGSTANTVPSSTTLQALLEKFGLDGLSWKTSSGFLVPKAGVRLNQLSTHWKKLGIWAGGLRATRSTSVCPTIDRVYSLSQLIDPIPPYSSLLTAANASGILRREKRWGRRLDPIFEKSLKGTIQFWCNVAAALGIPRQRVFAPRFALKPEDIKVVTVTGPSFVARHLTWNECEKLMGFPGGWTVVEGGSLATPSPRSLPNGLPSKSSLSTTRGNNMGKLPKKKHPNRGRPSRPLPEPIPDTPENVKRAILTTLPKDPKDWKFLKQAKPKA